MSEATVSRNIVTTYRKKTPQCVCGHWLQTLLNTSPNEPSIGDCKDDQTCLIVDLKNEGCPDCRLADNIFRAFGNLWADKLNKGKFLDTVEIECCLRDKSKSRWRAMVEFDEWCHRAMGRSRRGAGTHSPQRSLIEDFSKVVESVT